MKEKQFLRFFITLTCTILFIFLVYRLLVEYYDVPEALYDIEIFVTHYVVTLLIFFLLLKALSFEPHFFIQAAILSIVVKLVIYGAFILVIIYMSPDEAPPNVVLFCSIYLVVTVLELTMLYPVINKANNKSNNPVEGR